MSEAVSTIEPDQDVVVRTDVDEVEKEEIASAERKAGDVKIIPIGLIEPAEIALRGVNRQEESFQNLVESIRKKGVLNSILVREVKLPGGAVKYGLIDGLQRFTASKDAGLVDIPARIVDMDDAELLEAQVITNMNRVQTKPAELSKHLLRMLTRNPLMTIKSLAAKCCQSEAWVNQRLSLNDLLPEIQTLVNETKINLSNAYALSKLPHDEQKQHVDAAMTEKPQTFIPRMKERKKEIRDAKNAGRDTGPAEFKPSQHLQKLGDVKREYSVLTGAEKGDSVIVNILAENGVKVDDNVKKIVTLVTAWALHYDPKSQEEQRKANEARLKKREEEKERAKKKREEQRSQEAAQKAADLTAM